MESENVPRAVSAHVSFNQTVLGSGKSCPVPWLGCLALRIVFTKDANGIRMVAKMGAIWLSKRCNAPGVSVRKLCLSCCGSRNPQSCLQTGRKNGPAWQFLVPNKSRESLTMPRLQQLPTSDICPPEVSLQLFFVNIVFFDPGRANWS